MSDDLTVVYDGDCPVCKLYCEGLPQSCKLVDARQSSNLRDEIINRGLDIDQGMVVVQNGELHYGSNAIRVLATSQNMPGWRGAMNRLMFSTNKRAAIFYPLSKAVRNLVLRLNGISFIRESLPHNTIKHQLGDAWANLNPNIQERFAREPMADEVITYVGTMEVIRRSRMGWLFAHLTRIIGNPLTPFAGENIGMSVSLFKKPKPRGVNWQRTYMYAGRAPFVVTSTKAENAKGEMMECVGGGFGMKLRVYVQDANLHFESYRYFWSALGITILLPHWLSPGKTHVVHADLGNGRFTFTISMVHGWLGETFYQHGTFSVQK